MIRILTLLSSALIVAACGSSGNGTSATDNTGAASVPVPITGALPVCGTTTAYSVPTAQISGISSYPTRIYVPPDYATTTDKLPVIYIADGVPDVNPDLFFDLSHVCRILEEKKIRAIVVGLTGQNRETDYRMPGATSFYNFVTMELMPFVESNYRIEPTKRTLSGHSYGGLFVGYALTMDRPGRHYFANFIALDGSFWDRPNLMTSAVDELFSAYDGVLPGIRFLLATTIQGNYWSVLTYWSDLYRRSFSGLELTLLPTFDTTHTLVFDPGFSAAVDVIFNTPGM